MRLVARVLTQDGPRTRIHDFNTLPYRQHVHYIMPHSHSHGTSTEYPYNDYGSGWSTIREEDKRQRVRRLVWVEMVITLGTTFAEVVYCVGVPGDNERR